MGQVIPLESPSARAPSPGAAPLVRTDGVFVVFTSIDETLAAIPIAIELAKAIGVTLTLIHTRSVPYRLPVDAPVGLSPVETDAFVEHIRDAGRHAGVDVRVRVYLCRDVQRVVPVAFQPHSLIVVAGRRSWWPTRTERWRRVLERAGHFVVFVDEWSHREAAHA